jgi:holo-[acyl-carrier protein] synthase
VPDVQRAIERFGDRYLSRVFTQHELSCARGTDRVAASSLAARFAAKEATLKVLRPGPGPRDAVDWRSIEVRREEEGWCSLRLTGTARMLAQRAGVRDISVSLSHEGEVATAVVVALCGTNAQDETPTGRLASGVHGTSAGGTTENGEWERPGRGGHDKLGEG